MVDVNLVEKKLKEMRPRSAWDKGVILYAEEILNSVGDFADQICNKVTFRKCALNGACDWKEYSYGGCSLIYDQQIARRLCNPTEIKRTKGGILPPNRNENWLDVQTRALYQAYNLLETLI